MPPPSVQTTPTGDAEYTTQRQAPPAAAPPCVIQPNPDGSFTAQCGDKPPTPLRSFDDLVTYLRSEFAPADASADAGDVRVDQAGATAQA